MSRIAVEEYRQILADLATDEMNAFINSLPADCHDTIDRLLYARPLTNPDDNWLLRMAQLRGLDRSQAITTINSWQRELDPVSLH